MLVIFINTCLVILISNFLKIQNFKLILEILFVKKFIQISRKNLKNLFFLNEIMQGNQENKFFIKFTQNSKFLIIIYIYFKYIEILNYLVGHKIIKKL